MFSVERYDYFVYGCRNKENRNVREFRRKEVIHYYMRLSSTRAFRLVVEEKANT